VAYETVDDWTCVYPLLRPSECDAIIEANEPYVAQHVPKRGGGSVRAHPIDAAPTFMRGAQNKLYRLFHRVVSETGWDIPLDIARFGCSAYFVGDSMGEHVDDEERGEPPWDLPHRGISVSVQLSDPGDFDGGDLRTRGRNGGWNTAQLDRGDALVFGSSLRHEVTPVTYGERWVLLAWGYCNHFQRPIR
jgi:predicted 2-oxoglutarate/Fe(II)-dependent dioxygenase YbiX